MRIAFLANAASPHTPRWVGGLSRLGHDLHLISIHDLREPVPDSATLHRLHPGAPLGYFLAVPALRRTLRRIEPDLLHAGYVTGYGALARLSRFRPQIQSAWGTDVFGFPWKSRIHRGFVSANLRFADRVLSTSRAMADMITLVEPSITEIGLTPFGINTTTFAPLQSPCRRGSQGDFVVGTARMLHHRYGIDVLVRGFAHAVAESRDGARWCLRIAGDGPLRGPLQDLAAELGIAHKVQFEGYLPQTEMPRFLQELDVFAVMSRSESFGVAVLEASACCLPVVAANVGGLPEVVRHSETGFLVAPESPAELAQRLLLMASNAPLRSALGRAGRRFVCSNYDEDSCLRTLEQEYESVCNSWRIARRCSPTL